ncbi:hypothetical protein BDZ91DRAFT_377708 [Kalaharituber pfeilii]|nr:hypothetical protein BDZ91DRAFT_377708 [Kalaharituber pfeilii]
MTQPVDMQRKVNHATTLTHTCYRQKKFNRSHEERVVRLFNCRVTSARQPRSLCLILLLSWQYIAGVLLFTRTPLSVCQVLGCCDFATTLSFRGSLILYPRFLVLNKSLFNPTTSRLPHQLHNHASRLGLDLHVIGLGNVIDLR